MTESLNSLVRLDLITGDQKRPSNTIISAHQIEAAGLDHFGVLETRMLSGRLKTFKGDFAGSESLFRQVMADPATTDSLKWETLAAIARMYDSQSSVFSADREYRNSIEMFEASRNAIEQDDLRISFLARGIESYEAYIDFLIRHNRPLDALKIADQSRSKTLAEDLKDEPFARLRHKRPRPQELARRLNATLLFYWLGEPRSYLWAITPGKTAYFILPSAQQIDPIVRSYQEALLGTRDPLETRNPDAQKLYALACRACRKAHSSRLASHSSSRWQPFRP